MHRRRPMRGGRGSGRSAVLTVEEDYARIMSVRTGLQSSAGVTRVGRNGYPVEGKIGYLVDPGLKGQDPGSFLIRSFALPEEP